MKCQYAERVPRYVFRTSLQRSRTCTATNRSSGRAQPLTKSSSVEFGPGILVRPAQQIWPACTNSDGESPESGAYERGPVALCLDRSHRSAIFFAGSDAVDLFDRLHEDLAVSDFTRSGRADNRLDGPLDEWFGNTDVE